MSIKKEEFYEGAALLQLLRGAKKLHLEFSQPFFIVNSSALLYLKYCTRVRSPWGFTFIQGEQAQLKQAACARRLTVGLVCGHDGVVALPYCDYQHLAPTRETPFRIACDRKHREHYEVRGPAAVLERKVAPSEWRRLFNQID